MTITLTKKSVDLLSNEELIDSYERSSEMAAILPKEHKEHYICAIYHSSLMARGLTKIN